MMYRSNFVGTGFTVYDNGEKPPSIETLREELAAIVYVSKEVYILLCECYHTLYYRKLMYWVLKVLEK